MVVRKREGSLTKEEKPIIKALLARKWRNQDIQALLNRGRKATINSARITEVKQNNTIQPCTNDETEFFIIKKNSWDQKTGLNLFDDERLIRAREAILLAVQVFNSPTLNFKTEVFAVHANIAWTYLMHEYYSRKGVEIVDKNDHSIALSNMLSRPDCPLSKGIKLNLNDLKEIRDAVEHKLLGKSDVKWLSLFQACCLNFDKTICDLFGVELSLQNDLAFALQFAKLNIDQITTLQKYEIPEHIEALDARLSGAISDEQLNDTEYKFRVIYTFDSASNSQSHIKFVHPSSEEAAEIKNILVKYQLGDQLYPYKPGKVCQLVEEKSGRRFTAHNHTQAWKKYKVRPKNDAKKPDTTDKKYCHYHLAHKDYTYSEQWVEFLVDIISTEKGFTMIKDYRI